MSAQKTSDSAAKNTGRSPLVHPENCTGCRRCQLACSELYTKSFRPSAAYLTVDWDGEDCHITFTEECLACGICADECFFGALEKAPQEAV
jgi:Pyruvate/2-oxoacid:ferredoxin oxidoreductase delta subunit